MRTCSKCRLTKPETEFYERRNGTLIAQCKPCHNSRTKDWYLRNRAEQLIIRRARYKASGHTLRNKRVQDKHGITAEALTELHRKQKDRCAICNQPETIKTVLSLDHSHKNGVVRGLLCMRCNLMLGQAKDDISVLQAAIRYLTDYEQAIREG